MGGGEGRDYRTCPAEIIGEWAARRQLALLRGEGKDRERPDRKTTFTKKRKNFTKGGERG